MQFIVMSLARIQSEASIFAPHNVQLKYLEIRRSRQEIVRVYPSPNLAAHFKMQVGAG